MKWWSVAGLAAAIGLLAAARFVSDSIWIHLLAGSGACFGLSIALAVGALVRRFRPSSWQLPMALLFAVVAVVTRGALLSQIATEVPQINLWQLLMAGASVVWGAFGLLWGSNSISIAFSDPTLRGIRKLGQLLAGGLAVTLCLFAVAPLWRLMGVQVNHWTMLGLFGIAAFCYGCSAASRWLTARLRQRGEKQ